MEASHKTHRPHIKVGKDAEEEEILVVVTYLSAFRQGYYIIPNKITQCTVTQFNLYLHKISDAASSINSQLSRPTVTHK